MAGTSECCGARACRVSKNIKAQNNCSESLFAGTGFKPEVGVKVAESLVSSPGYIGNGIDLMGFSLDCTSHI